MTGAISEIDLFFGHIAFTGSPSLFDIALILGVRRRYTLASTILFLASFALCTVGTCWDMLRIGFLRPSLVSPSTTY